MKFRIFSILGILALLLAFTPTRTFAAPPPPNYSPTDVGPKIRGWEATPDRIEAVDAAKLAADEAKALAAVNASETDCITDTKTFLFLNDVTGRYGITNYNLMGESSGTQIWVQANLAWGSSTDPRPTPVITCSQVSYMIGQFDNNIYPTEVEFFGPPASHTGEYALLPGMLGVPDDYYYDEAGRQIVLVSNVRDDNYYDSTYPVYIAGFYSPTYEAYFDRNVMTIDAYDWANRTGPSGTRPYLYEGTFAHEYQHLLHDDYDGDEETFINEGMSDLAEFLTGYGISTKGHVDAAAANPENSLTVWGDQGDLEILTDYGQAYLFQYYLLSHFGRPFTQALFHNPDNGITGVNTTLAQFNIQKSFADLYHDWSVAALINSNIPADGRYFFPPEGIFYFAKFNIGTLAAPNPEAFSTPGAAPWGTDYLWIDGKPKYLAKFSFNGVDYSTFPTGWSSDGSMLWGGAGDLLDNWAIFSTTGGGTLTFDTKYDIEELWDFGFVQVSTDGGQTWTSLANEYTISDHDPSAHPKVIANLPGLTGSSGGAWIPITYDLSAYAGQDILVAFRYVTDWATAEAGWFIDNVMVDDVLVSDGSNTEPFQDITQVQPIENNFTVTFVGFKGTGTKAQYRTAELKLNDVTEDGLYELDSLLHWADKTAVLITSDAPEDFPYYVDYTFTPTYTNAGPKKVR